MPVFFVMTLFKPNFWLSFFTFFGIVLAKRCQDLTIPIELSVRQGVFDVPQLRDNYDACVFQQNLTSISGGVNYTAKVLTGYATVNGSYNISAELCVPDNSTANVIQVLTHGIGFDKSSASRSSLLRALIFLVTGIYLSTALSTVM